MPMLFAHGLSRPGNRIEPLRAPRILHLHLRMGLAKLACGFDIGKKGMDDHLNRLTMQGKTSFIGFLQVVASRPFDMGHPSLLMGIHAEVADLSGFHLSRLQAAEQRWRKVIKLVDTYRLHLLAFLLSLEMFLNSRQNLAIERTIVLFGCLTYLFQQTSRKPDRERFDFFFHATIISLSRLHVKRSGAFIPSRCAADGTSRAGLLNLSLPVRFKSKRDITSIEGKSGMEVNEKTDANSALSHGTLILEGRYRLLHLLHQRPRVNLYLAHALSLSFAPHDDRKGEAGGQLPALQNNDSHPLVAIRELVLNGLTPALRTIIEQATFEEFVSPAMLSSPRLPGTGDRMYTEGDRHYLIMHSGHTGSQQPAHTIPLANLLNHPQWPSWLDISTALTWAISLARLVARLHRLGTVIGDLDPATVLVDRDSAATWAPVLLMSWPPAPQFWPQLPSSQAPAELYSELFPMGQPEPTNPFIAPELLRGVYDQRSDIYSLGAIFYLLLTHYAPASATHRLDLLSTTLHAANSYKSLSLAEHAEHIELISPHHLNKHIPQALESIVLRTLAFDPDERYTSVFELVEALEALL